MTAVIALASPLPVLVAVVVWSRVAGRRAAARRVSFDAVVEQNMRMLGALGRQR